MQKRQTTGMRRGRGLFIGAVAVVAALAGATIAAGDVQPLAGAYQGTVKGTSTHNAGEGCFQEKPTVFGKRVKPASGDGTICHKQIIAPSIGPVKGPRKGCNAKPAVLNSGGFPIQKAAFHYKGKAKIGPHGKSLNVEFKGKWVTRTKVAGTTTIKGKGCKSTSKWTMKTPPPS